VKNIVLELQILLAAELFY